MCWPVLSYLLSALFDLQLVLTVNFIYLSYNVSTIFNMKMYLFLKWVNTWCYNLKFLCLALNFRDISQKLKRTTKILNWIAISGNFSNQVKVIISQCYAN